RCPFRTRSTTSTCSTDDSASRTATPTSSGGRRSAIPISGRRRRSAPRRRAPDRCFSGSRASPPRAPHTTRPARQPSDSPTSASLAARSPIGRPVACSRSPSRSASIRAATSCPSGWDSSATASAARGGDQPKVMPRFGAHMSVAGGLPRAVARAVAHRCEALQIFAKNANQWRGRTIPREEIREFRRNLESAGIAPVVSHASYLINLATANRALRRQSLAAMGDEIDRAEALGLHGVVLHPGCYTSGSEAGGLALIGDGLLRLLRERRRGKTMVLLEHTAGQGTSLGATFEQLASIIARTGGHARVGVCLDTCHLLASGYDIVTPAGYDVTFEQFGKIVGFDRLKVFHLNDSKKPIGSRVDRHEHIGQGHVGLEAFERLVNDRRFRALPMLLETPKGAGTATGPITVDPLDERNLTILRTLQRRI